MQFNSYYFILYFMPICLFLYYVGGRVKGKIKVYKLVLIVSSLFLFSCYGKDSLLLLILSLITNYTFIAVSKYIRWKKLFMAIPIVVNILLLFYFKYLNFTIDSINSFFGTSLPLQSIILPIGISFFTFQQIAYIVAVYKGEVKPGIIDYSCYILYFPKLVMGPLMDPVDFHEQINDVKVNQINVDHIAYGIKIFSYGLLKKVLLADTFYKAVEYGFSNSGANSSMDWLLIMLFYTFEIYFDFSGYSDMAIGTSLLFNIKLPINFDSPYKALSIRDFWKRWHISLTKFFTKYIYIPLGGNRKGFLFTCLNTMIVFLVSGIWHGANWTFIVWGGTHGLLSLSDRVMEKKGIHIFEPMRWILTFGVINVLWLLFRSNNIQQWLSILKTVLCFTNTTVSESLINCFSIPETAILMDMFPILTKLNYIRGFQMLLFLLIAFIICLIPDNNYRNLNKISFSNMIFSSFCMIWGIICLGGESVFLYFNF